MSEPPGLGEAAERLEEYGQQLLAAIDAAFSDWVVAAVSSRLDRLPDGAEPAAVLRAAESMAERSRGRVHAELAALLLADIDDQVTTPLSIMRSAVRYPTAVLDAAGAAPVERDEYARRAHVDDPYDLAPVSFADVAPELVEPAVAWGAAKAFVHFNRRRMEGDANRHR